MKNTKRFLAKTLLIGAFAIAFTACGKKEEKTSEKNIVSDSNQETVSELPSYDDVMDELEAEGFMEEGFDDADGLGASITYQSDGDTIRCMSENYWLSCSEDDNGLDANTPGKVTARSQSKGEGMWSDRALRGGKIFEFFCASRQEISDFTKLGNQAAEYAGSSVEKVPCFVQVDCEHGNNNEARNGACITPATGAKWEQNQATGVVYREGGNVGIGLNNPAVSMEVSQNVKLEGGLQIGDNSEFDTDCASGQINGAMRVKNGVLQGCVESEVLDMTQ